MISIATAGPAVGTWTHLGVRIQGITCGRRCGTKIKKNLWRFDYRVRASRQLARQRRVHISCGEGGGSRETQANDIAVVRFFVGPARPRS